MTARALDYATRSAICDTIATSFRESQLFPDTVPVPQLHGPCSVAVELFVIGAVLGRHVDHDTLPLHPEHFWSRRHARVWEAIQVTRQPLELASVAAECVTTGHVWGDTDEAVTILTDWAELAGAHVPLRDVAAAVTLLLEHARARRLVRLLARLADGLCANTETHRSAQQALREHFLAERKPAT